MPTAAAQIERTPRIELRQEGGYFKVINAQDSGNKVFHFLQALSKRGAFDCKMSHGPRLQYNGLRADRVTNFEMYAAQSGIETVRVSA